MGDSPNNTPGTFFEENQNILLIIGVAVGFAAAVCCCMSVFLHLLISFRLFCFKDPDKDTYASPGMPDARPASVQDRKSVPKHFL